MRDGNDLKVRILQCDGLSFHRKKLTSPGFISEKYEMPRVTSARRARIIRGHLKFRSEPRGGFRIRR